MLLEIGPRLISRASSFDKFSDRAVIKLVLVLLVIAAETCVTISCSVKMEDTAFDGLADHVRWILCDFKRGRAAAEQTN